MDGVDCGIVVTLLIAVNSTAPSRRSSIVETIESMDEAESVVR
jgi:hypothetical protein